MIPQKNNIVPMVAIAVVAAMFAFSLYVFLTTENTIIVVNETAKPQEVVVVAPEPPTPAPPAPAPNPRLEILETSVGFLNVRSDGSLQAAKVGTVKPGEVYEYTEVKNNWYRLVHKDFENAWVSGEYIKIVDRSSDLFGGGTSN